MSVVNKEKSKKMFRRLMLKSNHKTMKKIEKVCDYADKLGIGFYFTNIGVTVHDKDRDENLPPLSLEDIEDGYIISSFPFELEYKVCYDNPEYLKQEREAFEARRAREAQEEKAKEERRKKEEEERRLVRVQEKEREERKLYEKLKEKYG